MLNLGVAGGAFKGDKILKKKRVFTKSGKKKFNPGGGEPSRLGFGASVSRASDVKKKKSGSGDQKKRFFAPKRGWGRRGGVENEIFRWFLNRFRGVLGWGWAGASPGPPLVAN